MIPNLAGSSLYLIRYRSVPFCQLLASLFGNCRLDINRKVPLLWWERWYHAVIVLTEGRELYGIKTSSVGKDDVQISEIWSSPVVGFWFLFKMVYAYYGLERCQSRTGLALLTTAHLELNLKNSTFVNEQINTVCMGSTLHSTFSYPSKYIILPRNIIRCLFCVWLKTAIYRLHLSCIRRSFTISRDRRRNPASSFGYLPLGGAVIQWLTFSVTYINLLWQSSSLSILSITNSPRRPALSRAYKTEEGHSLWQKTIHLNQNIEINKEYIDAFYISRDLKY